MSFEQDYEFLYDMASKQETWTKILKDSINKAENDEFLEESNFLRQELKEMEEMFSNMNQLLNRPEVGSFINITPDEAEILLKLLDEAYAEL